MEDLITAPIQPSSCTPNIPYFSLPHKTDHSLICSDIILETRLSKDFLKPLASVTLHALSNILESYIYTIPDFASYVYHEQWSDYQCDPTYIGLKLQLLTSEQYKNHLGHLINYLNNLLSNIKQLGFSKKLLTKIQSGHQLLSNTELITSSGFITTENYWKKISLEDIDQIYASIHIMG